MTTDIFDIFNDTDNNQSFEESVSEQAASIRDAGLKSACMRDAYGNALLSIGTDDKSAEYDTWNYLSNDTLNWPLWLALYSSSWVVKRAIDKPAQDCITAGINIIGLNEEQTIMIQRLIKKYRSDFIQLVQWGNLFGGSIACLLFDNFKDEDYSKPLNIEKLKKAKTMRMYIVDRWYGVSPDYDKIVNNMHDIDFGKPMYYDVTLADSRTIRFHHDYVLRYEGRTAPKLIKNGLLQGWGYSELSHIFNEITRDEKIKSSVQSLIDKSLIEVIKMSGMRGIFMGADQENELQLRKRLEMVNWGRNFNSLTFLDKDDDYQMNGFSGLSGLSDILQQNMWMISSALEMQGILFGDLRGGFSSDESALEKYANVIETRSETYIRPIYEKILNIWYKVNDFKESVDFNFKSIIAEEQDDKKIEKLKNYVDLLRNLLDSGVIDTAKFAKLLQKYTSTGDTSITFSDKELNALNENFELESEDTNEEQ